MASIFPGGDGGLEQGERFKESMRQFITAMKGSVDEAYENFPNLFCGVPKEDFVRMLDAAPELFYVTILRRIMDTLAEGIVKLKDCVLAGEGHLYLIATVSFFCAAKEAETREGGLDIVVHALAKAQDLVMRLPTKIERGKE